MPGEVMAVELSIAGEQKIAQMVLDTLRRHLAGVPE